MLKILSAATLLAIAAASFAQTTRPGQTTPSVTPSDTPAVTPSQTPAVTPSQTPPSQQAPIVTPPTGAPVVSPPTGAPVVGAPPPMVGRIEERSVGGLSKCENMLAFEKEKCLQDEQRAATGATTAPGTTTVPGSAGMGTTVPSVPQATPPTAPQNTAPAGSVR
jgi:hypothetical protein